MDLKINKNNKKNWLLYKLPGQLCKLKIACSLALVFIFSQLQAQTDGNPSDWQALISGGNYVKINSPRVDRINSSLDDILGSGAKDVNNFSLWHWAVNSANDKTDIQNATIVLLPGHFVRFAADRFAQNGDAEIGIWLLKGSLSENSDFTFTGVHTNGDVLITSKFTNGGTQPNITVRTWQNGVLSSASNPPSGHAAVNTSELNVPGVFQNFKSKFGAQNKYPAGAFFEGELDLDDIQGTDACFTRFLFETSQSQASTESLGDFLLGNFNTKPNPPSVTNVSKCFDGTAICATADCGSNNGTLVFYDAATGGNIVQSPCRTAVGTSTYYAACASDGCESDRVAVTATVYANPTVNGLIQIESGVTQLTIGNPPVAVDDIYQIKLSTTNVAHLYVQNPVAGVTYTWTRINCDGTAYSSDGKSTFTPNGSTATLTFTSAQSLANSYCFRVTASEDHGNNVICTATDEVEIRPLSTAIRCTILGDAVVCAGSTHTYVLDADNPADGADALDPDFNYVWSISGNGTINNPDAGKTTKSGTNTISVTAGATAGSYTVTLTITGKNNNLQDPSPCTATATVTLVSLSLGKADVTCNGGSNGTVTATFSGGTSPYKVQIDGQSYVDPATSPYTFQGLSAGSHTVHVVDKNGCEASSSITVGQADALTLSLQKVDVTCNGGSNGSVTATFGGGSGSYEAQIDGGGYASATSPKVFGSLSAGSHTVDIRDANDHACTKSASITVGQPDALTLSLQKADETCAGHDGTVTATFGGGSGSYEAQIDGGGYASATSPKVFGSLSAGSHTVDIRDANDHACTKSASITVGAATACAHIFPTQTTCCNYLGGNTSAFQLQKVCATVSGSKIGNAIPGVFFYYGTYMHTGATGSVTIQVRQSWTPSNKLRAFAPLNDNNLRVFVDNCQSVPVTLSSITSGTEILTFNAVNGKSYVISVKYDTKSIIGSNAPSANALYSFSMYIGNSSTPISSSSGQLTVDISSGCADNTPAPSGTCPSTNLTVSARKITQQNASIEGLNVTTYPNPFTDQLRFVIQSQTSGNASLELYNVLGQKVSTLFQGHIQAGHDQNIDYKVPVSQRTNLIYIMKVNNKMVTGKLLNNK